MTIIAEERNCSGSTMNWLMPISASCWRSSSASAFESDAMITMISTAAASVTSTPAEPPGKRAPASSAIANTVRVWTTVVTAW